MTRYMFCPFEAFSKMTIVCKLLVYDDDDDEWQIHLINQQYMVLYVDPFTYGMVGQIV